MKWKQIQRKLIKGAFFVPELVFQCALIVAIFKGPFEFLTPKQAVFCFSLSEGKQISLWLPESEAFTAASCFFAWCVGLLLWQILGAGWNGRGLSSLIIQILAFALRAVVANFLFDAEESGVSKVTAATLASAGLAIVVRTGSSNGQARAHCALKSEMIRTKNVSSNAPRTLEEGSLLLSAVPASLTNGFARFAADEHRYHSFANQVSGDVKPWPIKPKPGKFKIAAPKPPDFASLAASGANDGSSNLRMRPSRLVVDDPLEVESLFSSFSLSDSPCVARQPESKNPGKKRASTDSLPAASTGRLKSRQFWFFFYNCALSLALVACRVLVGTHLSLISIVLAANFGLRGFIWPRLGAPQQAAVMALSLLRLLHLSYELSQNEFLGIPFPAQLIFDVILILNR